MGAMKLLSMAAVLGFALFVSPARGRCSNSAPTVTFSSITVDGKPALRCDIVDPDGVADLIGFGFSYIMEDGSTFKYPQTITLWMAAKKKYGISDIPNGKRLCMTQIPAGIAKLKVTATDYCFQQTSATADVAPELSIGAPRFGPPKKK